MCLLTLMTGLVLCLSSPGTSGSEQQDPTTPAEPVASLIQPEAPTAPSEDQDDSRRTPGECAGNHWGLLALVVVYIFVVLVLRHIWVVVPNRNHLSEKVDEIEADLKVEQVDPATESEREANILPTIQALLDSVRDSLPEAIRQASLACPYAPQAQAGGKDKKWWRYYGTGKLQAGWRRVHQAEVHAVQVFSSDIVRAKARLALRRLTALKTVTLDPGGSVKTKGLVSDLRQAVKSDDLDAERGALSEALTVINEARDAYFETLSDWFNKAIWIVLLAAALLVALALTMGNAVFFLLGAIGGLLSKLRGVVHRQSVPFDYGVSWTSLFLTPLVGALTGWTGILVTSVLADQKILGSVIFEKVTWQATSVASMALAIVFGYSASLFETLMDTAEKQLGSNPSKVDDDDE